MGLALLLFYFLKSKKNLLTEFIWCKILNDHKWTIGIYISKDQTKNHNKAHSFFIENTMMICERCGNESNLSKDFRKSLEKLDVQNGKV